MSVHAEPPPAVVREPQGLQYVTGRQLGKGGFAICHSAEMCIDSKPTGQIVALKIVKSKMEPPKLAQKFVTELQLHSKLHHPNIVEFYRAFSFEQSTYVVLELCGNGSLADALRKRSYFTMPEIRRWLIQICGAVKYLHHRNIVHRDLKTGNLFLDKGMNIKVGDFGLAAVLVSKHDIGMRRTTMCGTPNYLAPEILEKGGRGHNEKVDLWAIGIIAYTLAVGKAPFHASKREDIYKKLQQREYKWPELAKNQNDISTDLRDLVSSLLVHEDDRPCPDEIVSHSFFKTKFIPGHLDSSCTSKKPNWPGIRPPSAETLQRGFSESWRKLCKESGVGIYAPGKVFPLGGSKRIVSVVKDCEKEIAAGRAPMVPIPTDSVYLPFPERINLLENRFNNLSEIAEEREPSVEGPRLVEVAANLQSIKLSTQAAKTQSRKQKENAGPVESMDQEAPSTSSTIKRKTSSRKKPEDVRPEPSRQASGERCYKQRVISARHASREQPVEAKPMLFRQPSRREKVSIQPPPGPRPRQGSRPKQPVIAKTNSTPVLDCINQRPKTVRTGSCSEEPVPEKRYPAAEIQVVPEDPSIMIGDEAPTFTDPVAVLARASKLRDNIASALSGKKSVGSQAVAAQVLPFVSKWVDYAKKHGVGYVLADGSIGCLFNATNRHPVTHAVVRHGYSHLEKVGKNLDAVSQVPLDYYAHCEDGKVKKAIIEGDRRRTTGILWAKFGRYMCQQLGQAEMQDVNKGENTSGLTLFVRYYQRLGAVGVWGFSNGCFQFNFPDHTKLVLSADGKQCSFTCLTAEAMAYLLDNKDLPLKYIKRRAILSGPLSSLLFASCGGEEEVLVTKANMLREKLEFIIEVMSQWIAGGGLGCSPEGRPRIKWNGPRLDEGSGKKEEWITVGRFGGDGVLL